MNWDLNRPHVAMAAAASGLSSWSTKKGELPVLLIVEDEILLRMTTAEQMRGEGFVVLEAANGDEALSLLRSYPLVDAVFSDVRMPGETDGIALAEIVNRYYPRTKIFLTSGVTEPPSIAAAFFPKPYAPNYVARVIKQVCGIQTPP